MDDLNSEGKVKRIIWKCSKEKDSSDEESIEKGISSIQLHDRVVKQRPSCDGLGFSASKTSYDHDDFDGACMMPLLPVPGIEECSSQASVVLTGTARRGGTGPPIGAVDIGVSKLAYYFRIALPGVKKDPGQFSCEIGRDGRVYIQGETLTGGRTVSRYSRVFEMKTQHQCPPGPFTLSFSLPGPVDPRLFSPYFRSDGIFEAVVGKHEP